MTKKLQKLKKMSVKNHNKREGKVDERRKEGYL
jgi:hypothetical protein